jgi:hypothetical protein
MTRRTKKPKDDPALTALGLVEMDETSDYVARGRAFKGREDAEVIDLWVAAFEKLFITRGPEAKLMVDDLQAELRLRKIEPPEDRIPKTIREKMDAEMFAPGAENDPRWDALERKFLQVLAGLKKPKN